MSVSNMIFLIAVIVGVISIVINSLPVAISSFAITIFGCIFMFLERRKYEKS